MPRCAVLGDPVDHSLSPVLHRAAYVASRLAWEYDAQRVPAGGLATFVAGLGDEWRGLSLTMPLKREALVLPGLVEVGGWARAAAAANTLVRVVGCLPRQGSDWILTSATTPERVDKIGEASGDASRPLGNRTMALKFVLTRLDSFVGQRMAVSGMLMGAGGVDGINVTSVSRVSETCP